MTTEHEAGTRIFYIRHPLSGHIRATCAYRTTENPTEVQVGMSFTHPRDMGNKARGRIIALGRLNKCPLSFKVPEEGYRRTNPTNNKTYFTTKVFILESLKIMLDGDHSFTKFFNENYDSIRTCTTA
jgi:hypothetical protein